MLTNCLWVQGGGEWRVNSNKIEKFGFVTRLNLCCVRYIVSLYYALMQISTVGFGDIYPKVALP